MMRFDRAWRQVAAATAGVLGLALMMVGVGVPAQAETGDTTYPKVVLACWKSDDPDLSSPGVGITFPQSSVPCSSVPVPDGFGWDRYYNQVADSCTGGKWQFDWYYIDGPEDEAALASLKANGLHWLDDRGMAEDAAASLLDSRSGHSPNAGVVTSMPDASLCHQTPPQPDPKTWTEQQSACDLSTLGAFPAIAGTAYWTVTESYKWDADAGDWVLDASTITRTPNGADSTGAPEDCGGEKPPVVEYRVVCDQDAPAVQISTDGGAWLPYTGQTSGLPDSIRTQLATEQESGACAPDVSGQPGDLNAMCVQDIPYLDYAVKLPDVAPKSTVDITFLNPNGENYTVTGQPLSGRLLWPGASANPDNWPGWERFLEADGTENWRETTGNYAWTRAGVDVRFDVHPPVTTASATSRAVVVPAVYVAPVGGTHAVASAARVVPVADVQSLTVHVDYPQAGSECWGPQTIQVAGISLEVPAAVASGEVTEGMHAEGLALAGAGSLLCLGALLVLARTRKSAEQR